VTAVQVTWGPENRLVDAVVVGRRQEHRVRITWVATRSGHEWLRYWLVPCRIEGEKRVCLVAEERITYPDSAAPPIDRPFRSWRRWKQAELRQIALLRGQGLTCQEIGDALGVSHHSIAQACSRHGISRGEVVA